MDVGSPTLTNHLKRYAHLFTETNREGEPITTFHISKTMGFVSTMDPIPIPHHPLPDHR